MSDGEFAREMTVAPASRICSSLLAAAAGTTIVMLGGCHAAGILDPQGPVGAAERLILLNSTVIMLAVVIPVIVMTLAFAWWFRSSNARAQYDPDWTYSGRVELVTWSIPTMVVLLLAGVTWIGSHDLDPARRVGSSGNVMRIQAVSLDWKWLFIYPDLGVATVNQVIVPAGTSLEFSLTSASVMNAFFVPQLGSQIYTMPGMTTHLNLLADNPGDYAGISSHFSGDGFSDMRFIVHSVSQAKFDAWVTHARANGKALDVSTYIDMEKPSSNVPPATYGGVESNLFLTIIHRSAPMMGAVTKAN